MVSALDVTFVMTLLGQGSTEVTAAVAHLVQTLFNWYAGLEDFVTATKRCEQEKKKGERVCWPRLELSKYSETCVKVCPYYYGSRPVTK